MPFGVLWLSWSRANVSGRGSRVEHVICAAGCWCGEYVSFGDGKAVLVVCGAVHAVGSWGTGSLSFTCVGGGGAIFLAVVWLVLVDADCGADRLYVENYTVDASILDDSSFLGGRHYDLKVQFYWIFLILMVIKFLRANGGCLGIWSRRRTW